MAEVDSEVGECISSRNIAVVRVRYGCSKDAHVACNGQATEVGPHGSGRSWSCAATRTRCMLVIGFGYDYLTALPGAVSCLRICWPYLVSRRATRSSRPAASWPAACACSAAAAATGQLACAMRPPTLNPQSPESRHDVPRHAYP